MEDFLGGSEVEMDLNFPRKEEMAPMTSTA